MDWNSINQEAVTHLQNLIRINTTNPPGNEIKAVTYLASILKKEGINYQIFEPSPGRASLVARLKGTGDKKPLLLTSHLDVVPAEESLWEKNPFSGEIHQGYIWGRGALDMKHMTVMELMMLLQVKRRELSLSRDLIFAAVADEEAGCQWGSQWLVDHHPHLFDAEYALNEVGGFSLHVDSHVFYPIGVAERGRCWIKLTAQGKPGHGSLPHQHQALVKAAEAAYHLGKNPFPFHVTSVAKKFISTLAEYQKFPKNILLKLLLVPGLNRFLIKHLLPKEKIPAFMSLLFNTATPTLFHSGQKVNVIPSTAELTLDGRILPGQTVESFLKELEKVVGFGFSREIISQQEPTETDDDNEFYDLLAKTLVKHDKRAIPVPYLIPGYTDASHFSRLGIKCYGFTPLQLDKNLNFSELFHGHNERIPVEGFLFGLKVLWDVVRGG